MTRQTPTIRAATLDDIDELVRLRRLMFQEMGTPTDEPTWPAASAAFLHRTMVAGTSVSFVADTADTAGTTGTTDTTGTTGTAGRLVASGTGLTIQRVPGPGNPSGTSGYIQSMVTERPWRGRGLARGIVEALLDWYRARGITRVDLHATGHGRPVYEALGFTPVERFPEMRWDVRDTRG